LVAREVIGDIRFVLDGALLQAYGAHFPAPIHDGLTPLVLPGSIRHPPSVSVKWVETVSVGKWNSPCVGDVG